MGKKPQTAPSAAPAKKAADTRSASQESGWHSIIAGAAGLILGIALLKFGNPIIFDGMIQSPSNLLEFLFHPWPIAWGYGFLAMLLIISFPVIRLKTEVPRWLLIAPLLWLGWQFLASARSFDPQLSQLVRATLIHFVTCLAWFYLGVFGLSRLKRTNAFWVPLILAFLWMIWIGFEQHYGGLEATRRMFFEQPDWQRFPADYIKRISSNRIFATLVYPNALAGVILLLTPSLLWVIWSFAGRATPITRLVITGAVGYGALACLFWSGSKAGWLIALALGVFVLLHQPMARKLKILVVAMVLVVGLIGFFVRFANYFHRGATSVGARMDYWNAAVKTTLSNPILGTGPGTFSRPYSQIKSPEAEMAKLVHNDYLEQATDSGIPGFLIYAAFIVGLMFFLYRKNSKNFRDLEFWVLLGLIGWALQSFVEFPLYIPAISWPVFAFLGWMAGAPKEFKSTAIGK